MIQEYQSSDRKGCPMDHLKRRAGAMSLTLLLSLSAAPTQPQADPSQRHYPWQNPELSPDLRAEMVVRQMTEDEKFSWLSQLLPVPGSPPASPQPGAAAYYQPIPRLGIPSGRSEACTRSRLGTQIDPLADSSFSNMVCVCHGSVIPVPRDHTLYASLRRALQFLFDTSSLRKSSLAAEGAGGSRVSGGNARSWANQATSLAQPPQT